MPQDVGNGAVLFYHAQSVTRRLCYEYYVGTMVFEYKWYLFTSLYQDLERIYEDIILNTCHMMPLGFSL